MALAETCFLWPEKGDYPDFALSVGTSTAEDVVPEFGPRSPVTDRFFRRVCKTSIRTLDGQKTWKELQSTLPANLKSRCLRLNVRLCGPEPAIDDVSSIKQLKVQTEESVQNDPHFIELRDSLMASIFYFEFEGKPTFSGWRFHCVGHICCRLDLSRELRQRLYRDLQETSSYFLVDGAAIPCIPTQGPSISRRRVGFSLSDLTDSVAISLRGITSRPRMLSGLPNRMEELFRL